MMIFRAVLALILTALPALAEIRIQPVTSPGGITAWLVEDHSIPFAALEIQFRGGKSLDAPETLGAVNLMTGLLEEGAGDLDAQGFARSRDALAAQIGFRAYQDSVGVSVQFLTEFREPTLALLREALVAPRFDPDAVERVRQQVLTGLRADAQDPGAIGSLRFDTLAFPDHPYGRPGDGTLETVAALTRDDLIAAHRGAMAKDRIYVAAAGDITADELAPILDRLFADLPATGLPLPEATDWTLAGGVTVEPFPAPQSEVLFGHGGLARDDPDFFAAFILNDILGGGRFSARLMTEVRVARGLSYGIGTSLVAMDHAAMWLGQFSADNAKVAEAIEVVRGVWGDIAANGVDATTLEDSKRYLTGSYPLRFDGNGAIAQILVGMQMDDLPIDYAATRNAKVEAVTADDIKRVAARLLSADALHFVVVGQPEGLTATP